MSRCQICERRHGENRLDIAGESGISPVTACTPCFEWTEDRTASASAGRCIACRTAGAEKYEIGEYGVPGETAAICKDCRDRVLFDSRALRGNLAGCEEGGDSELLILSEKTDLDIYCPGCAEFILHLGVKSRDDVTAFEARCPRCDVVLLEHTAIVADSGADDERDDFRDATVAGWRELVEGDRDVYLPECEYRAEALGWDIDLRPRTGRDTQ